MRTSRLSAPRPVGRCGWGSGPRQRVGRAARRTGRRGRLRHLVAHEVDTFTAADPELSEQVRAWHEGRDRPGEASRTERAARRAVGWMLDVLAQPAEQTREQLQTRLLADYTARRDAELVERWQALGRWARRRVDPGRRGRRVRRGPSVGLRRVRDRHTGRGRRAVVARDGPARVPPVRRRAPDRLRRPRPGPDARAAPSRAARPVRQRPLPVGATRHLIRGRKREPSAGGAGQGWQRAATPRRYAVSGTVTNHTGVLALRPRRPIEGWPDSGQTGHGRGHPSVGHAALRVRACR
jgi:hypothetical protein